MRIRSTVAAATAILTLAAAGAGHASATTASIWINDPTPSDASIVPAGPADATFAPGVINYQSGPAYTISEFLNNPTFSNESAAFIAAGAGAATINNSFIQITGTVGMLAGDNSFVVGHDDGVVLSIAGFGTVVNQGGPTGFTNTPFTVFNPGAAGNFTFTLNYTECCGAPADLLFTVNNVNVGNLPEPASWSLMLLGVSGVGGVLRRKTRQRPAAA